MAFTQKSLRNYDSRVLKYTRQLSEQMHNRQGQDVNASTWMRFFSIDIMGKFLLSPHPMGID